MKNISNKLKVIDNKELLSKSGKNYIKRLTLLGKDNLVLYDKYNFVINDIPE